MFDVGAQLRKYRNDFDDMRTKATAFMDNTNIGVAEVTKDIVAVPGPQ